MEAIEASQGFAEEIDATELCFLEVVGKGAFGVVSRARWKNKDVAVKLIETESEKKAFITELKQLSRVNHPNIVRLYGACTKQPVCLVMEYAEGGSLYNVLHGQGPQPQYTCAHAMSWALQCARGVEYLHGMKPKALIHRDLKPPNLLLVMGGTVLKICDFGTACDIQTHMTNNKGSAAWMAPEVFEGCRYTEKCDVFSWAIILWEVLTRRKPFDEIGGPAFRIMWAVHNGTRPPLIKNLPKPLQSLMTTCWAFNAAERPSMSEVVRIMTYMFQFFKGADESLVYPPSAEEDMGDYTYNPPMLPSALMTGTFGHHYTPSTAGGESHTGTIRETIRQALARGEPVPVVSPPALQRATPPVVVEEEQGGKSQKSAPASLAASRESLLDNSRSPRSGTPVDQFKRYSADLSRLDEIDIMSQGMNAPQPVHVQGHRRSGSYGTVGIVTHGITRPVSSPTVRSHRRIGSDEYTQVTLSGRSTPTGHSGSPSQGRTSGGPALAPGIHHVNTYPGTLKQHGVGHASVDVNVGVASSSSTSMPSTISHSISYTPGLSIQVPTEESTAVPTSGTDYAMNMVYLSLDHQLQPLTPYPTNTESMAIYERHCELAQYYLRVQTEIALLVQRKHELIKEFEQEEQMSEQKTSHLAEEYTRLCIENENLKLLHQNVKKQVEQIRRNQQQNRRVPGT